MQKKTILLENDDWFWPGLEAWCKKFDLNFVIHRTGATDWRIERDYAAVGFLSQPFIDKIVVASAFEGQVYTTLKDDPYPQLLHYLTIIESAFNVREKCGYDPFEIHINYHGNDFIEDVLSEKWGWDTSTNIKRFVRQNPDTLKIHVYKEYEFQYTLSEENLHPKTDVSV